MKYLLVTSFKTSGFISGIYTEILCLVFRDSLRFLGPSFDLKVAILKFDSVSKETGGPCARVTLLWQGFL